MASKPRHERRVFWLALLGGFPGVALAIVLLWLGDFAPRVQWTLGGIVVLVWLITALIVRENVPSIKPNAAKPVNPFFIFACLLSASLLTFNTPPTNTNGGF